MDSNISKIFVETINEIKSELQEREVNGKTIKAHHSPVDIEISFNQLQVTTKGIKWISKISKKDDLTIKIATRIMPEDFND